ncbi:thioredoxin [Candidatus Woesearchaeota archaeon]|nr:MAG: thioredoxin [Candidatus Woesearchaeota archaeon]
MENLIEVNDSDFEEKVINKSKEVPVVVDFWAAWCGPCVMLGPTLERLAEQFGGKFILAKLNVDENPSVSQTYRIMSIPSVKMFKDGKVADEFVGALPEPMVKEWLDKNLS